MSMSDIVFISPDPSSENGQNIITRSIYSHLRSRVKLSLFYKPGFDIFSYFACLSRIPQIFLLQDGYVYIVVSRSFFGFLRDLPFLALSFFGLRVIAHSHGSDILALISGKYLSIPNLVYKSLYRLITPSRHVYNSLISLGFSNSTHIDNYYCKPSSLHSTFSLDKADKPSVDGKYIFYWNSNIIYSKGFFHLLHAFDELYNIRADFAFLSIGNVISDSCMSDAKASELLAKYINKPWFHYFGPQLQEVSSQLLLNSDCVALLSFYSSECQPLSLIEAMCQGLSLLIHDSPALLSTVGEYPAYTTTLDHPSIVAKLNLIINSKYEQKGRLSRAANLANRRFSHSMFIRSINSLFL